MRMTLRLLVLVTLLASVTCLPDYSCLTAPPPQPCNLQIIYPEPIGITECDGEYTMKSMGVTVFQDKPTLKAAIANKPKKLFLFVFHEDFQEGRWGATFTIDDSCTLHLESEDFPYQKPGNARMAYFLFDFGTRNEKFGNALWTMKVCELVNNRSLGPPIAVGAIRFSQSDSDGPADKKGQPLTCPTPGSGTAPGAAPGAGAGAGAGAVPGAAPGAGPGTSTPAPRSGSAFQNSNVFLIISSLYVLISLVL
ncbi:uncharacterized protein LOC131932978 isoform X2 [Physella acuta]|nr:uncharacterized protein LOC131932978 isoform X2 [Physella acuta]